MQAFTALAVLDHLAALVRLFLYESRNLHNIPPLRRTPATPAIRYFFSMCSNVQHTRRHERSPKQAMA